MKQEYPEWCRARNLLSITNSNDHGRVWAVSRKCESFKDNATNDFKIGISHIQCRYLTHSTIKLRADPTKWSNTVKTFVGNNNLYEISSTYIKLQSFKKYLRLGLVFM